MDEVINKPFRHLVWFYVDATGMYPTPYLPLFLTSWSEEKVRQVLSDHAVERFVNGLPL